MNDKLMVNEIFLSIEGEGKRAGELAAFIRLSGCNLRCSYCDTEYAFSEGQRITPDEIARKVWQIKNVTLTGGEPLSQNVHGLLELLRYHNVNIETNGSIDVTPYHAYPQAFMTLDYKCPSSGMESAMLEKNFKTLRPQDVLKFVVGNREDLVKAWEICRDFRPVCPVYVSPVFGKIEPAEIVEYMKENLYTGWRLQLQLHKFIWNPEKRGV